MGIGGGVIALLLMFVVTASSQKVLFTVRDLSVRELTQPSKKQLDALADPSFSEKVWLITAKDLREVVKGGFLTFYFPDGNKIVIKASMITDNPQKGFVWSGNIVSGGNGYAVFRVKDNMKSAIISVDGTQYEMIPLDPDYQALVKKKADFSENGCALELPPDITTDPLDGDCEYTPDYNTCPALIDILIAVEPEAAVEIKQKYGTLDYFLWIAEHTVNFAFWNSDIPNKEVNVKWIELESYGGLSSEIGIDVDNFKFFAENNQLRTIHHADIILLLTTDRYDDVSGAVNAIGPGIDDAYGIVETSNFYAYHIFAHEVGHTLGCRHEWGADNAPDCAHGYLGMKTFAPVPGMTEGTGHIWTTLMHRYLPLEDFLWPMGNMFYLMENEGTILHYSNPTIIYDGIPTGSIGVQSKDNAQKIRNTGCTVANFTPSSTLSVAIIPSIDCSTGAATYTAQPIVPAAGFPGQPPYAYNWSWSLDGVFDEVTLNTQQFGNTQTATLPIPPSVCEYWVRCTVSSPVDGVFISRIMLVNPVNYGCLCVGLGGPEITDRDQKGATHPSFRLLPNPVENYLRIEGLSMDEKYQFFISDAVGRIGQSGQLSAGNNSFSVAALPKGYYQIAIVSNQNTTILSFIKQ